MIFTATLETVLLFQMKITSPVFQAYLECPAKCFLRAHGEEGTGNEYADWVRTENESYRRREVERLANGITPEECVRGLIKATALKAAKCKLALDVVASTDSLESELHAVETVPSGGRGKAALFIPVRFIFRNKLTTNDKLLLAFDAFVLSATLGRSVGLGKIIHGDDHAALKVKTVGMRSRVGKVIAKVTTLLAADNAPDLILNRHCGECEYQTRCRQKATEKDDLSLLSGMPEKERKKLNGKGIFTVTQLSYTFRPRRRPKRQRDKKEKYHHSLKALAIREKKIHIVGTPELKIDGTPVYLDVEGLPDQDFYYLIGVRIGKGESAVQHSLWADSVEDEKRIWESFLTILNGIEHPVIVHYGSYETTFLKRMCERYHLPDANSSAGRAVSCAINILSVIYAHIYIPAFSNGLKSVAGFLGFTWSGIDIGGLQSIVWRKSWERELTQPMKDRIIRYNAEDCAALGLVTTTVLSLLDSNVHEIGAKTLSVVHAESIVPQNISRWRLFASPLPSLEYVTTAAHWDYQRDRVYARSGSVPKKRALPRLRTRIKRHVEKVLLWPTPPICPKCGRRVRAKGPIKSRTLQDIVFGRASLKRRLITYVFQTYRCVKCGIMFGFPERYRICRKHGWDLAVYLVYQFVELCIPQITAVQSYNRLFGYGIHRSSLNNIKCKIAAYYDETRRKILDRIVHGDLIHADETRAIIKGKSAYVWVLTSLQNVVYIYSETREGEMIQKLLADFKGVLVTDFYTAYDSITCPQQRCLIHLVRDLNDEILGNPFDENLKFVVSAFGDLLRQMVSTVDRHGLKARFLGKHLVDVDRFYSIIERMHCQTDVSVKCVQRLERNRDKLFTFLRFDDVPWNNNNAEHAIKAFAKLRDVVAGTCTTKGMEEYLTLLSVCQTCKYRGVDFLDFLRSGEKDLDVFAASKRGRRRKTISYG